MFPIHFKTIQQKIYICMHKRNKDKKMLTTVCDEHMVVHYTNLISLIFYILNTSQ